MQVSQYPSRQFGPDKSTENLLIAPVRQGYPVEVVLLHELIENICAQHDCSRDGYHQARIPVEYPVLLNYRIDKSQSPGFPADRSFADPRENEVLIEFLLVKYRDHRPAFTNTITGNGFIDVAPDLIHIPEILIPDILEALGNGEQCPGIQPFGNIIPPCVVFEYLIGNLKYLLLKGRKVSCPVNSTLCFRVAYTT